VVDPDLKLHKPRYFAPRLDTGLAVQSCWSSALSSGSPRICSHPVRWLRIVGLHDSFLWRSWTREDLPGMAAQATDTANVARSVTRNVGTFLQLT